MGEGFQFIDIVLFAMVAAFLVLRLRSVLGRHKDHGRPQQDPYARDQGAGDDNIITLPDRSDSAPSQQEGAEMPAEPQSPLEAGYTQIRIADSSFEPGEFLNGAKSAFEMILQAFGEGDRETLQTLLSNEVYENFLAAIRSREEANQTLENTLIRMVSAEALEAYMENTTAFVTVKIVSEQVNVVRDAGGEVVDGNPNHIAEVTDIWTFARDTKSRSPNWELVATRSLD